MGRHQSELQSNSDESLFLLVITVIDFIRAKPPLAAPSGNDWIMKLLPKVQPHTVGLGSLLQLSDSLSLLNLSYFIYYRTKMYSCYGLQWSHFKAALKENLRKHSNLQSVCILFLEDFLFSDTLKAYFWGNSYNEIDTFLVGNGVRLQFCFPL